MTRENIASPKSKFRHEAGPELTPRAAYFDAQRQAWILSRYSDVLAALHEPQLWLVGGESAEPPQGEARAAQARVRVETQAALPAAKLAQWRSRAAALAEEMAGGAPVSRPVDMVGEFARPWALAFAVQVTGCDSGDAARLAALAATVSLSTADPDDVDLKKASDAGGAELDAALSHSAQPMAGPAFTALSQTLPALLANAWLILLGYPSGMEQLREDVALMPKAVEELLRLAGLARVLHRRALTDVTLGNLRIASGQRVDLMAAVANHDPEQFPEPDRFDFSRRPAGQFALGAGQHSCAAGALIRMAVEVATGALVDYFVPAKETSAVEWQGGSGFRWPARVYAMRRGGGA